MTIEDLKELLAYAMDRASRDLILATELNGIVGADRQDLVDRRAKRKQWLKDLVPKLDEYMLVHKSHVRTMQAYDMSKSGYLTRADIMAMGSDICPDVEIMYSKLSMEDLLKQHEDWTVDELIRYLEAPKPEQTQPAHP